LKHIALLAFVLVMFAVNVCAQPEDGFITPQDSLQISEEEVIPVEEEDIPVEEEDIPVEEEVIPVEEEVIPVEEEVSIQVEDEPVESLPNDPSSVLQTFFQALKSGDDSVISQLISDDALDEIEVMLDILKENLDDSEETTMTRLIAAGYSASADEIDDWSSLDYLLNTVVLPVMKARYALYEMQIGEYAGSGDELVIPLVFITASGVELQFEAILIEDDNQWKVSNFIGLNSFP